MSEVKEAPTRKQLETRLQAAESAEGEARKEADGLRSQLRKYEGETTWQHPEDVTASDPRIEFEEVEGELRAIRVFGEGGEMLGMMARNEWGGHPWAVAIGGVAVINFWSTSTMVVATPLNPCVKLYEQRPSPDGDEEKAVWS